ncbi:MAG: hypothetical protein M9921_09000 [Fimbriimonadaceae bacterium]|nr:hypothetical protein [Chthonomonadaceae bacterium]MCO5296982.1 hypothetical protein [Fimbriimonadaceae bacterium]
MDTHLNEQQIREVLARAGEIQMEAHGPKADGTELESIVAAAEEAGLSRQAVLQALRERVHGGAEPAVVGDWVFAESADGKYYVAEVLEVAESSIRVRFVKGGERTVGPLATQPCTFLPGQRIVCQWPDWGWWTSTVISYDERQGSVSVSDGWGSMKEFPIAEVRLDPPRSPRLRTPLPRLRFFLWSLSAGIALGGLGGAFITWLLLR